MNNVLKFPRRRRSEKAIEAAQERKLARLRGQPIDPKEIPQTLTMLLWFWMAGINPRHTCTYSDGTVLVPTWVVLEHLEKLIATAPHQKLKADLMRCRMEEWPDAPKIERRSGGYSAFRLTER